MTKLDQVAAAFDSLVKRVDTFTARRADAKYLGAKEYYVIHYTINGRTQRYEVQDRSKADAKVAELWKTKGVTDVDMVIKEDKGARGDGIESPEFKEGYDAGKAKKEAKDNPYPLSSQKGRDWRSGWAISQVKSK